MKQHIFSSHHVWKMIELMSRGFSLTEAARKVGMELPAASKAISRLEQTLDLPLVDRTVRPMRLSAQSVQLLPKIRDVVAAQEGFLAAVGSLGNDKHALLRFSLSHGSLNSKKMQAFNNYQAAHPDLQLEVVVDKDHLAVLRDEVQAAAVSYPVKHPELAVFPLGVCANLPLASPKYLARCGVPHEPEDLRGHTLLLARRNHIALCDKLFKANEVFCLKNMRRLNAADSENASNSSLNAEAGEAESACPADVKRVVASYHPTLLAAVQGHGICFDLALGSVRELLLEHKLVPVLNGWHRQPWRKSLIVKPKNLEKPWIKEFVDWYLQFDPACSKAEWTHWYEYFGVDAACV